MNLIRQFQAAAQDKSRGLTYDNTHQPIYGTAGILGGGMTLCSATQGAQTFTAANLGLNS